MADRGRIQARRVDGPAEGARYIGTLAPGQCKIEYWLISYPQCVNVSGQPQLPPCNVSITGDVKPTDDVSLDYDVWATTTTGGVATAVKTRSFTLRTLRKNALTELP